MKKNIFIFAVILCISKLFAKETSILPNKKFYGINQLQSDSFYSVEIVSGTKYDNTCIHSIFSTY